MIYDKGSGRRVVPERAQQLHAMRCAIATANDQSNCCAHSGWWSCSALICYDRSVPYLRDTNGYRPHENTAQKEPAAQGLEPLNGTVLPRLTLNRDRRPPREYLTSKEVERLIERARKRGRYGLRDATMILIAYRHGLWAGELCALRWD
jgi:hypothetical protein